MHKLLFVTNSYTLADEITASFSKVFLVKSAPFDWNVITTMYKEEAPDLFVVNTKNMDNVQYRVINDSLDTMKGMKIPFVLIGNREEEDLVKRLLKESDYVDLLGMKLDEVIECLVQMVEKKKIMLVDDDPMQLRNMNTALKGKYQVSMAPSGILAMSLLGKSIPDLILLDYEMPVCDGPQTLAMIRAEKLYQDIPVIFLTSVSEKERVVKVLEYKPQGYILKTLPQEDIIKQIDDFFEHR